MFSKAMIAAFAATLLGGVNAHFNIKVPSPIPGSASKTPLDPSGSNFPCQGADLSGGSVTNMAVGSTQPLQFDLGADGSNWAVHGGGSCQISITYETEAAKLKDPNNWKVIHSWVGGCPTNAKLNLDPKVVACSGSDSSNCVSQDFTFSIPPEVKSGAAIMAWTWFNNIGNREMYMNCAKVQITGGSGDGSGLPSMFAANIGNGCSTNEQFNTDFPNPGKYITKDATLNYPLKAPTGSCGSGAGSANVASTPSSSSSGSGSSSGTDSAAPATSSKASGKGGKGGKGGSSSGTFAEGAPAVPSSAPVAAAAPAPAAAASTTSSGSCTNGQVACSASGFYCIDASHFGECAYGCAIPQAMAAGTMCANNAVAHAVVAKRRANVFTNFFSRI